MNCEERKGELRQETCLDEFRKKRFCPFNKRPGKCIFNSNGGKKCEYPEEWKK